MEALLPVPAGSGRVLIRADIEQQVLAARRQHRRGQDWLAEHLGLSASTIRRILRRHDMTQLGHCDPMTGALINTSKTTSFRFS